MPLVFWRSFRVGIDIGGTGIKGAVVDLTTGGGAQTIQGRAGVGVGEAWTMGVDPFASQLKTFAADIASRAGVTESARASRGVAVMYESCRALRQPLPGPASPEIGVA